MYNTLMTLKELAKKAVETYLLKGEIIEAPTMRKKAGVFITIEKENQLRGCIGTYLPTKENIAEETISNAIAAAFEDPRFPPVQKEELPFLSYAIYILNKPELIKSIEELNPKKYGIIVKSKNKSGLLLPDLKGIETTEEQVSIACQKAGIDKEKITIYRFTVIKQ